MHSIKSFTPLSYLRDILAHDFDCLVDLARDTISNELTAISVEDFGGIETRWKDENVARRARAPHPVLPGFSHRYVRGSSRV